MLRVTLGLLRQLPPGMCNMLKRQQQIKATARQRRFVEGHRKQRAHNRHVAQKEWRESAAERALNGEGPYADNFMPSRGAHRQQARHWGGTERVINTTLYQESAKQLHSARHQNRIDASHRRNFPFLPGR
jgi:hypothetical protein